MGIAQGSVLVNTRKITALADQIKNTGDCESLELMISDAVDQVKDLISGIGIIQGLQLSDILPLLTLPSPDPFSIVSWLGKLVTGTALPQMMAYIKYTLQLIQLGSALSELQDAIQGALDISICSINPGEALSSIQSDIDDKITANLVQVSSAQDLIGNIVPGLPKFDTTNPLAFKDSVTDNLDSFNSTVSSYIQA